MPESTAQPVLELIAQNVLNTLQAMARGYVKGDLLYGTTFERKLAREEPANFKGVIFQNGGDDVLDAPIMTDEWVQPFSVVFYVLPTDLDDTPVDTYANVAYAEMYQALMADRGRGGYAQDTRIRQPIFLPPIKGEFGGLTFNFDVRYRNLVDQPYIVVP